MNRKKAIGQGLQMRTFFFEAGGNLPPGRAMNALVGHLAFPLLEVHVLGRQGRKPVAFERVVPHVGHPVSA